MMFPQAFKSLSTLLGCSLKGGRSRPSLGSPGPDVRTLLKRTRSPLLSEGEGVCCLWALTMQPRQTALCARTHRVCQGAMMESWVGEVGRAKLGVVSSSREGRGQEFT